LLCRLASTTELPWPPSLIRLADSAANRNATGEDCHVHSLGLKAYLIRLQQTDHPFGWNYTFEAQNYAKHAGNLLLVRPRVLGIKGLSIRETKEPRIFPIELDAPARDTDVFEIAIPDGYVVDDLPPPVDADYTFASYHSKPK
jgi:hypothetical protein